MSMNMSADSNETTTSSSNELAIQRKIYSISEYQLDYRKLIKLVAEFRTNIERFDVISKQAPNYYNYYLAKSIVMRLASKNGRNISFTGISGISVATFLPVGDQLYLIHEKRTLQTL